MSWKWQAPTQAQKLGEARREVSALLMRHSPRTAAEAECRLSYATAAVEEAGTTTADLDAALAALRGCVEALRTLEAAQEALARAVQEVDRCRYIHPEIEEP
jgi:HAMP domain-containing protein